MPTAYQEKVQVTSPSTYSDIPLSEAALAVNIIP